MTNRAESHCSDSLVAEAEYKMRLYHAAGWSPDCPLVTAPAQIPAEFAIVTLVAAGHCRVDVQAAFDNMVDAGLQLDQPGDGYVITPGEFDLLRERLTR